MNITKKSKLSNINIFLILCVFTFLSTSLLQAQDRRDHRTKKEVKEQVVLNPDNPEPPLPNLPTLQGTTWRNWLISFSRGIPEGNQTSSAAGFIVNLGSTTATVRYVIRESNQAPPKIKTVTIKAGKHFGFSFDSGWVRVMADQPIMVSAKRSIVDRHYEDRNRPFYYNFDIPAYPYPEQ